MSSSGSALSVRRGQLEVFFAKHGNLIWKLFVGFFVLYILMPPLLLVAVSFEPSGIVRVNTGFSLRWYDKMINSRGLMDALFKSILLAFLTTAVTTLLALQAALGYRKARFKTLIIAIMILPIFLPGIIQGFSLSLLLTEFLGLQRSLWTELVGHVLWALPFAFLVILTSMSVVKRETVLAAMDLGANEWRAFRFNEFSRTYSLQGIGQTTPTYVWNKITVAIAPEIFALSSLTVILSLTLIAIATIYLTTVGRVAKARKEKAIPRPAVKSRHKAPAPAAATAAAEKA